MRMTENNRVILTNFSRCSRFVKFFPLTSKGLFPVCVEPVLETPQQNFMETSNKCVRPYLHDAGAKKESYFRNCEMAPVKPSGFWTIGKWPASGITTQSAFAMVFASSAMT